jgi:hypothetical protein
MVKMPCVCAPKISSGSVHVLLVADGGIALIDCGVERGGLVTSWHLARKRLMELGTRIKDHKSLSGLQAKGKQHKLESSQGD